MRNAALPHLLYALLAWASLGTQLWITLRADGPVIPALVLLFSYFTILTNSLAAVVATAIAVVPTGRVARHAPLRASVAVYIIVVGVVYHVLLAPLLNPVGVHWVLDHMFHTLLPIYYVALWVLCAPKAGLRLKHALYWLIYPIIYCAYAMVRGEVTGLYPYPFLDPTETSYSHVLQMIAILTVAFLALGVVQILLTRIIPRREALAPRPPTAYKPPQT